MTTATSSLSNTRQFTTFVATSVAKLTFITGKRKSDGTDYSLFECISKNTGEVMTIGIGKSLKGMDYKAIVALKQDLFISEIADATTGDSGYCIHLRGERNEITATNDFA